MIFLNKHFLDDSLNFGKKVRTSNKELLPSDFQLRNLSTKQREAHGNRVDKSNKKKNKKTQRTNECLTSKYLFEFLYKMKSPRPIKSNALKIMMVIIRP